MHSNDSALLRAYLDGIGRLPIPSASEQLRLARQYQATHDPECERKLASANLRLVVRIARAHHRAPTSLLDLIQEGNLGLMHAIHKFDPERGIRFTSYSAWWIRAYVLRFIVRDCRLVSIGTTRAQRRIFFRLGAEKRRLARLGIEPDREALATGLGVTVEDLSELESHVTCKEVSLDAPLGEDQPSRLERLTAPAASRPDALLADKEVRSFVRRMLDELGPTLGLRERMVLSERCLQDSPVTLQSIADRAGITREGARQIERRMLGRFRQWVERQDVSRLDLVA